MNRTTKAERNWIDAVRQILSYILFVSTFLSLSACGGGGGGGGGTSNGSDEVLSTSERVGIFVDSPVEGLGYSLNGVIEQTDSSGRFRYLWDDAASTADSKTRFYLGRLFVGEVTGRAIVTPVELFNASSSRDPRVVNFLRLLQTLDTDNEPDNGIALGADIAQHFTSDLNLDWSGDLFAVNSPVSNILNELEKTDDLVSAENALAHFDAQLSQNSDVQLFTVSGMATGVIGDVELELNSGEQIIVRSGDEQFGFDTRFSPGSTFSVSIKNIVGAQNCTLDDQIGRVGNANISGVNLTCSAINSPEQYSVGGEISGLSGSVLLRNQSTSEHITVTSNGSYAFDTLQASGTFYDVSITENPANQTCSFTNPQNASGEVLEQSVLSINIACVDNIQPRYFVGGAVSGLSAEQSISLSLNGGPSLSIDASLFSFAEGLLSGDTYSVSIVSRPNFHTCLLENAQGSITDSDVTDVSVSCSRDAFDVGGEIAGHNGPVSILASIDGEAPTQKIIAAGDSAYLFENIPDGSSYQLSVIPAEDSGQQCQIANAAQTLNGSDVSNADVLCSNLPSYSIGGDVSGLSGNLVLQNNGTDQINISASGQFTFGAELLEGQRYSVEILSAPASQTCAISSGTESGEVGVADIDTVQVICEDRQFSVSGSISGHSDIVELFVSVGGQVQAPVSLSPQDTNFDFGAFAYNASIAVTVTDPAGQNCQVENGSTASLIQDLMVTIQCVDITTHVLTTRVSGLPESISLDLTINSTTTSRTNGALDQTLFENSELSISLGAIPEGYSCTVSEYASPIVQNQSVEIACAQNVYQVSGQVEGIQGADQVALLFQGQASQLFSAQETSFSFSVAHGEPLQITSDDSLKYECAIEGGNIASVNSALSNIVVNCSAPTYAINGTVEQHLGVVTLTVDDQYGEPRSQQIPVGTQNFQFTGLFNGAQYQVSSAIGAAANQTCSVSNASGTINGQNVSDIRVICSNDPTYSIGGQINNLARGSVTLVNTVDGQETDVNEFTSPGAFTMGRALFAGQTYSLSVQSSPSTQNCAVSAGGQGTVSGDVNTIVVDCSDVDQHTITAQVRGLGGQDTIGVSVNGGGAQATGNEDISSLVYDGLGYSVSVSDVPEKYTCSPMNANIEPVLGDQTVTINCALKTFTVSGTVTGLGSDTVALNFTDQPEASYLNNQGFSFSLPYGSDFSVSDNSLKYDCAMVGGNLSNLTSSRANLVVNCEAPTYRVSGAVTQHTGIVTLNYEDQYGSSSTLQLPPGTEDFAFTGLFNGAAYQLSVAIEPSAHQSCAPANLSNTISGQDINNIAIICSNDPTYSIGGQINDLARGSVTLVNTIDGSETNVNEFSSQGAFTMDRSLYAGQAYSVAVSSSPSTQDCEVSSGGQGVVATDVNNIVVDCTDVAQYTITAQIRGLEGTDTIGISINENTIQAVANGDVATLVYEGQGYSLAISDVPEGFSCSPINTELSNVIQDQNIRITCQQLLTFSGTVSGHRQAISIQFDGQRSVVVLENESSFSFTGIVPDSAYDLLVLDEFGQALSDQICEFTAPVDLPLSGQLSGSVTDVVLGCKTPILPENFVSSLLYECVRENPLDQNQPYLFVEDFPVDHRINCSKAPFSEDGQEGFGDLTGIDILAGSNTGELLLSFQPIPDTELSRLYDLTQLSYLSMVGTQVISGESIAALEDALRFTTVFWQNTDVAFAKYFSLNLSFSAPLKEAGDFGYMSLSTFNWYAISQFVRPLRDDTSREYNYAGGLSDETVTFDFSSLNNEVNCQILDAYDDTQDISCDVLNAEDTISVQLIGSSESEIILQQMYVAGPYTENFDERDDFWFVRNALIDQSNQQLGLLNVSSFKSGGFSSEQEYFQFVLDSLSVEPLDECLLIKPDASTITQISDIILTVNCDIGPTTPLLDLGMSSELYNCVSQNGALTTIGDVGTNLSCTYDNIRALQGIQYLTDLTELNLKSNSIPQSEMTYLYGLDGLTLLNLAGNDLIIDNDLVNELETALPFTAIRYTDTDVGAGAGSALFNIDVQFSPEALASVQNPGVVLLNTPYWGGVNCDSENLSNCTFRNVERAFSGNYQRVHELNHDTLNDFMLSNPDYSIDQSGLDSQLECHAFSSSAYPNSNYSYDASLYIRCGLKSIRDISGSVIGDVWNDIPDGGLTIEAYLDSVKVSELVLGQEPQGFRFVDINEGFYELRLSPPDTLCSIDNAAGVTTGEITDANLSCGQIKNVIADPSLRSCLESTNQSSNTISSVGANVDCSFQGITDLEGIQYFTQIKELTLTGNDLSNEDFNDVSDPIYRLKDTLELLDINGNYGIRLTSICDGVIPDNLPFTVVRNTDLNCAGPDRTLEIGANVSFDVERYFTDFGTAYVRGVRLHGWSSDTFDVSSSALTDSGDTAYFSGVRDGSSARLEFDRVRPSLECFDAFFEVTSDIYTSEECSAKQLVDIEVTLDGGGYDSTGRESEVVSGLELTYQRDYPYNDNFISTVGLDWSPGNSIVFPDFPSGEQDVSVLPGYNFNFFSAPEFVYCDNTTSKAIGSFLSSRSFVVPCSQSYIYGSSLSPSLEAVSEYADERMNYALQVKNSALNQPAVLDLTFLSNANVLITNVNNNTNIATSGSTSLGREFEWNAQSGQQSVSFDGFTEPGTYFVSVQNTDTTATNGYELGISLVSSGHSDALSLRPMELFNGGYTRTWQQTVGNATAPSDRLNNPADVLVVKPMYDGAGALATVAVKITLTSAVDTYLILTDINGVVIAVSDDAGALNRSIIFKDLAPGSYRVIPATYSEVTTPTDYVLNYESSMPAYTYID